MSPSKPRPPWHLALVFAILISGFVAGFFWLRPPPTDEPLGQPRMVQGWYYVWPKIPRALQTAAASKYSNIAPGDYVGPATCAECHSKNYHLWSQHSHRWMNAEATQESVKGRFDGSAIPLRGGAVTVFREGDTFKMRVERGDVHRVFRVTHTIGRRYHQYYIGVLESGTEIAKRSRYEGREEGAPRYERQLDAQAKLVLPLGYRVAHDQWVPVYGVFSDNDDDFTGDPYENFKPVAYYGSCANCHTTMPQGYRLLLDHTAVGLSKPAFHFDVASFLEATFAQMTDRALPPSPTTLEGLDAVVRRVSEVYSPERAVALGISCEACHYGGREHAASQGKIPPRFFPSSPHLVQLQRDEGAFGRTPENLNMVCAQCHSPPRLTLPGGASRLNSSEYRDAISGHCYSQLTCVHCHEPHTTVGPKWSRTADQDDASCIACHRKYEPSVARVAHAHHAAGSEGARCMNCHMPRVTEGMEDLVRTHQISSPTNRQIIENGGANACNLCHLDQSIDWALGYLAQWYGAKFDEPALAGRYAERDQPLGRLWLQDRRYEIRRIGLGAARRARATWLAKEVAAELNDAHNINRQFAQSTLEDVLGIDFQKAGYYFWMTPEERANVMQRVLAVVQETAEAAGPSKATAAAEPAS